MQLPSEPAGICHPDLQANIDRLYRKKVEQGYDMNKYIQNNKAFRNPSIYEKLIQECVQQSSSVSSTEVSMLKRARKWTLGCVRFMHGIAWLLLSKPSYFIAHRCTEYFSFFEVIAPLH